jgi:hypothetical protein
MAKHRELNTEFGVIHVFDYPCGHSFNQEQDCPVCSSIEAEEIWKTRWESMKGKLELRDQMLLECEDAFLTLIEQNRLGPEVKHALHGIMTKIDTLIEGNK